MVATGTTLVVMGLGRTGQIPKDLRGNGMDLEMDWLWRAGGDKGITGDPF